MKFQHTKLVFLTCFFMIQMNAGAGADVKPGSKAKECREKLKESTKKCDEIQTQANQELSQLLLKIVNEDQSPMTEDEKILSDEKKQYSNNIAQLKNKEDFLLRKHKNLIENVLNDFEVLENTSKNLQDENSNLKEESKKERSEKEKLLSHVKSICKKTGHCKGDEENVAAIFEIGFDKEQALNEKGTNWLGSELDKQLSKNSEQRKDIEAANKKIEELTTTQGALASLYKNLTEWGSKHQFELAAGFVATALASIGGYVWYTNKKSNKKDNHIHENIKVVWMQ